MALRLLFLILLGLSSVAPSFAEEAPVVDTSVKPASVYIIPINGPIDQPNLYILRRGLKDAIANKVDMVLLDMDTPGGRGDIMLEMMEMLDRFDGITATYVNEDAISAGAFIASATDEIYFTERGKIGAAAAIQSNGQDIPETALLKANSYIMANVRLVAAEFPYRSEAVKAMMDKNYEFVVGEKVLKTEGELLTLTSTEAMTEYGDPPRPLFGNGIYASAEALLDARFGAGNYVIKDFHLNYSEELAKWMNTIAPALMGLGMLLLFIEFKTPGFGIFGIGGIALIGIFFASQYVAGLAGNEPILSLSLGLSWCWWRSSWRRAQWSLPCQGWG